VRRLVQLLPADSRGNEGGTHVDPEPVTHHVPPMSLRVQFRALSTASLIVATYCVVNATESDEEHRRCQRVSD
jgi:hypothetical protein